MKKKVLSMILAASVVLADVGAVDVNHVKVSAEETTIAADTTITSVPQFNNLYDFSVYVDNADTGEYNYVVTEKITKAWNGVGGVHTFTAPEDGMARERQRLHRPIYIL